MAQRKPRTPEEESLLARARAVLPGGCVSGFHLPEEQAVIIAAGQGSKIYDRSGNEYIDYVLGSGPLLLGHAHPAVVQAVMAQAPKGSTFYAPNEAAVRLAEKIHKAVPCAEKVRFTASGSEATFFAMRLARAFTGRDKILKTEGGFHGNTDYALMSFAPTSEVPYPEAVPDSDGIPAAVKAQVLIGPYNDLETMTALIERHRHELAGVIVEPLQRFLTPKPGFLEGLREVTRRHGVLLIFDEVVTGFRLALGGAQEYYGVVPDLAAYGKTISGGYTLAAVCGRADILDLSDPSRKGKGGPYVVQGGTFSGNPISASAGYATLCELEKEGVYPRLHAVGRRLRAGMAAIAKAMRVKVHLMGDGPMWFPVFTDEEISNYRGYLRADRPKERRFSLAMLRHGCFVNPGMRSYISLAHSDADLEVTLGAFQASLSEVENVDGKRSVG